MNNDVFSTRDIYLASTLMTLGFPIVTIDYQIEGERSRPTGYFGFTKDPALMKALDDYRLRKISLVPQDFVTNMRSLHADIHNVYKNPHTTFKPETSPNRAPEGVEEGV